MVIGTAKTRNLRPSRTVVLHVDDLGGSHGANRAFLNLAASGLVTCGSVMVPAPWFREIADVAQADSSLDIGVHLTLTSEWKACRWAPISTVSRASGLIDPDGYFWRDVQSLRRHVVAEAAEMEMRAQIERVIATGLRPTHLDAHMAAAMSPELLDIEIRLGREYGLVPVLPRSINFAPDPAAYDAALTELHDDGAPLFDNCRSTLAVTADRLADDWRRMVKELPAGITHFALHCTAPSDFEAMAPEHAPWRYTEYEFLTSGFVRDLCATEGIEVIGTRRMQELWLAYISGA